MDLHRPSSTGNNQVTLLIDDSNTDVRIRCPGCGAEQTVPRSTTRATSGRLRHEPEDGQWLPCHICQDWSPLEAPPESTEGPPHTRSIDTPAGPVAIDLDPAGWSVARTHVDIPFKLADADLRALCEHADAIWASGY